MNWFTYVHLTMLKKQCYLVTKSWYFVTRSILFFLKYLWQSSKHHCLTAVAGWERKRETEDWRRKWNKTTLCASWCVLQRTTKHWADCEQIVFIIFANSIQLPEYYDSQLQEQPYDVQLNRSCAKIKSQIKLDGNASRNEQIGFLLSATQEA